MTGLDEQHIRIEPSLIDFDQRSTASESNPALQISKHLFIAFGYEDSAHVPPHFEERSLAPKLRNGDRWGGDDHQIFRTFTTEARSLMALFSRKNVTP